MPIDPVCGMEVASGEAVETTRYGGKTHYFCSEECRHRFEKQPTIYTE